MTQPSERYDRILAALGRLLDELREVSRDELEEISDLLIDELMDRVPLPRWALFVRGWLRRRLDALFPEAFFQALKLAVSTVRRRSVGRP